MFEGFNLLFNSNVSVTLFVCVSKEANHYIFVRYRELSFLCTQ